MVFILGIIYVIVIGAVFAGLVVLLLKGKKEEYNKWYVLCQGTAIIWCCSQIMILLSETDKQLLIAYTVGNIGICFIGTFWYMFSSKYAAKKLIPYSICMGMSIGHLLIILTNEFHHMYYKSFSMSNVEHGLFFYTNIVSIYILVGAGAFLLLKKISVNKADKRGKRLIIIAVLIPLFLNILYMIGLIRPEFDITPLGFGISGILIMFATIKYRFLEVNITAFDVILSALDDGVAIFSKNGSCTYNNEKFYDFIRVSESNFNLSHLYKRMETFIKSEDDVYKDELGRCLHIQFYSTENDMTCVTVKDMTRYYELLEQTKQLGITNEKLALEKERNRIAQQVHDTAGHTLTMLQSYMKVALAANDKDEKEVVNEHLLQAKELASDGIKELRQSINNMRKQASYELITQGVMQLADQVKELPVEVTVQGEDSQAYSHRYHIIYDSVREAITNCIKYANASKLEIVLRFYEQGIELIMGDDGIGCENINDNNGLRGIKERVNEVGGKVKIISGENQGFLIRINVPI